MNIRKPYSSIYRQEQKERTREHILDGLVRAVARGFTNLSIPAVAKEADVSIPTVYRYFKTKQELIDALGSHLAGKVGVSSSQLPRSPEDLVAALREMYVRSDELDDTVRAALMSEFSNNFRKTVAPERLKAIEDALAPATKNLSERDRIRLRNVILILSSSAVLRAFKDYLNLSGEEAADNVTWAILKLTRDSKTAEDGVSY